MSFAYALLVGIAMGALLQRVGASSPTLIVRSLRLEDLTVIKFMATTIAVGSVTVYALRPWLPMHLDIKPTYLAGVTMGGLIFGAGFALASYCPGTCLVGIGEGRKDALIALVGGIAGALAFDLAYFFLEKTLIRPHDLGKLTLDGLLHVPPLAVAAGLAILLLATVALVPTRRRPSLKC